MLKIDFANCLTQSLLFVFLCHRRCPACPKVPLPWSGTGDRDHPRKPSKPTQNLTQPQPNPTQTPSKPTQTSSKPTQTSPNPIQTLLKPHPDSSKHHPNPFNTPPNPIQPHPNPTQTAAKSSLVHPPLGKPLEQFPTPPVSLLQPSPWAVGLGARLTHRRNPRRSSSIPMSNSKSGIDNKNLISKAPPGHPKGCGLCGIPSPAPTQ